MTIDALGERHTVWTTDGERRRIGMRKSVRVIDSSPTANKKGLRIKLEEFIDDYNPHLNCMMLKTRNVWYEYEKVVLNGKIIYGGDFEPQEDMRGEHDG